MDRIASGSVAELLERAGPAIAAGAAILVSVAAIRERSGDRWARKREAVESFLHRAFERVAGPSDLLARLNEAEFLLVQPDASRIAAIGLGRNLLRETLQFFLGESAPADVRVLQVKSFTDGVLEVEQLDPKILEAADQRLVGAQAARSGSEAGPSPRSLVRRAVFEPLGVELSVTTTAEPIWHLTARAVVSYELRPEILSNARPSQWPTIGPRAAREVALAGVAHAGKLLTGEPPLNAGLHVAVPLGALAHSGARYSVLEELKRIDPALRRLLILELTGVAEGAPQGRVAELVGMLAPYCRAVLARAPGLKVGLSSWRGTGLAGVTFDGSTLAAEDRSASAQLEGFADAALAVAPACIGYRLATRSLLLAAWAQGFTHVSGPPVSECLGGATLARRLQPDELYFGPSP